LVELELMLERLRNLEGRGITTTQQLLEKLEIDSPKEFRRKLKADRVEEHADLLKALRNWDEKRNYYLTEPAA
jgi:hypothetical protein